MRATTVSVSIGREAGTVYAFVADLANLPKWATSFVKSIRREKGGWVAQTSRGAATFRIAEPNAFGVLDHWVSPAPGVDVYVPMRVVANGPGSEVLFTLFQQPGQTDAQYAEDRRMVEQDLATLKRALE